MNLIEKIFVEDFEFKFFTGVDFKEILKHPKDGSNGFIICYIESWFDEVKKYERDNKIDSVLNELKFNKFKSDYIDNNYVSIYQLSGLEVETLHDIIKNKALNKNFTNTPSWVPIQDEKSGLSIAWKIQNSNYLN